MKKTVTQVAVELLGKLKRRGIRRITESLDRIEEPGNRRRIDEYIDKVKPDDPNANRSAANEPTTQKQSV